VEEKPARLADGAGGFPEKLRPTEDLSSGRWSRTMPGGGAIAVATRVPEAEAAGPASCSKGHAVTFTTRLAGAFGGIGLAVLASAALAAETRQYDARTFAAAQSAGSPIVVEINAPWCPTCKAQKPIIESLAKRAAYKDLVIFQVDFDSQKNAVRSLGARTQSTLIAYAGKTETARSVGDTRPDSIEALFQSAVAK
jgi:thioredoxin 1